MLIPVEALRAIERGLTSASKAETVLRRPAHGEASMIEPTAGAVNRLHPNRFVEPVGSP